jgi:signal transduction histidine kinase
VDKSLARAELQRELVERIYRFMMQLRFVIAPLPVILGGIVLMLDHTLWRRVAIGGMLTAVAVTFIMHETRARRTSSPDLTRVMLVVGAVVHPVILIATGGVLSPVILAMLLIDFIASTLLEPRVSRLLLRLQACFIVTAAVLEYTQVLGTLLPEPFRAVTGFVPSPALLLLWTAMALFFFVVTRELGLRMQSAFSDLLLRTTRARDETLRIHQEQMSELTQLSAEIAHELKNPLASVKGLAALLARRNQGEQPEALTVLRREVDRMQNTLEEFLNYSRPLVPLSLENVDLASVVRDVAALHTGTSEMREIEIRIDAPEKIEVRCDPRKVRQILVNLLQNALDVTAAHGSVSIQVHAAEGSAEVHIDDAGTGLDPAIAERVFEAGVTNKPGGSGLGLNVARGLARQHGGDVLLTNHPRGGCRATLRLPCQRPSTDA